VPATSSSNESVVLRGCAVESHFTEVSAHVVEGVALAFNHLVNRQTRSYLSLDPIHKALYGRLRLRVEAGYYPGVLKVVEEGTPEREVSTASTVIVIELDEGGELVDRGPHNLRKRSTLMDSL
jgi:hypothetical protein